MIGLTDLAQQIDEFHLGKVEIFDLDMRNDLGLQRFQLHALGIGDGPALLFLTTEGFELPLEIGEHPAGVGILGHGFLCGFETFGGGVLLEQLSEFLGHLKDLLGINGHVAPC